MTTKKARERREWGSIEKRGRFYYARYTNAAGNRTKRKAGTSVKSADALLKILRDEVEAEIEAGESVEPVRLEDWLRDEYLRILASRLKESSLLSAAAHFTRLCEFLRDEAGDPTMGAVTRADAEEFVAWMTESDYAASYVARVVRTVRGAWNDALSRGLVAGNPWKGLRLPRVEEREIPWVTPAQLVALYGVVTAGQRSLIVLLGETGLRLGEALALRWDDVDLDGEEPSVFVRTGKTKAARRMVPLSPTGVTTLRGVEVREQDDLVFTPRSQQGVLRAMKVACKKAGLPPNSRVHDLRHWYASHLVQAGEPPPTVALLLGHSDGGALVCRRYGRWMPKDAQQRAATRLVEFRATR